MCIKYLSTHSELGSGFSNGHKCDHWHVFDYYLYDLDHLNIIMIAVPVLWHVLWSFGTDTISELGFTATM